MTTLWYETHKEEKVLLILMSNFSTKSKEVLPTAQLTT